jgi:hypothetical protein
MVDVAGTPGKVFAGLQSEIIKWRDRLNYETEWLDRQRLVDISYDVVRTLYLLKNKYGQIPDVVAAKGIGLIDSAVDLLGQVDRWERIPDGPSKTIVVEDLRRRILNYNREQFRIVRSQQRPVDFGFSSSMQWFDTEDAFDRILKPCNNQQRKKIVEEWPQIV